MEKDVDNKKQNDEKKTKALEIKKKMINDFARSFDELVLNEQEKAKKQGISMFEKNMYHKMGISKAAFQNYKKGYIDGLESNENQGRLPGAVELYKIHEYFNVPYSYLFGEAPIKNIDNLEIGFALGLDDESIEILNSLKKKASVETINENYEAYAKLFLINNLIHDDKFLSYLATYFSITLGRNILDEKYKDIDGYSKLSMRDDIFEMTKFGIMSNWLSNLDKIVEGTDVPLRIKLHAEEQALKYGGKMQDVIKKTKSNEKK